MLNHLPIQINQPFQPTSPSAAKIKTKKVEEKQKTTSLPELNAVLNLYNVHADRGRKESRVFKNNGLLYKILDQNSKPIGVPIKASEFYSKPTLKFLEEKFKSNDAEKESCKKYVKNAIKMAFYRESIFSTEKLFKILEAESIHMILRKSKEGQLYGITYVDHKTRTVFNGSSLGKEYSAKGIQKSCALNILTFERKYQKSNSTSSENFKNLESQEYVKENLADILLRGEKITDYVSKQFKQKKKEDFIKGSKIIKGVKLHP